MDKNREKGKKGGERASSSDSSDVSDDDNEGPDELLVPEPGLNFLIFSFIIVIFLLLGQTFICNLYVAHQP